jgi:hypothetical protein
MKNEFSINPKTHEANLVISPDNISNDQDIKNLLALITIIGADFYLDPEISIDEMKGIIDSAHEKNKQIMINFNEEEIDMEFIGE